MADVNTSLLAQKLRELRGAKSLYLVQQEMGVDRGSLRKYETGRLLPEKAMLEKLATYYQIDFASLLKLILADQYPEHSLERAIVIEWVREITQNL